MYYARLRTPTGVFYKLGYTKKSSLRERLAYAGLGDENLIDREFLFAFHDDAWNIEQDLLDHFDKHRAFSRFRPDPIQPLARRGQSELFRDDILGLDEELYRLTDAELQSLRQEAERSTEGCAMVLIGIVLAPFTLGLSLFFLMGGFSGIFGSKPVAVAARRRPEHPEKITRLVQLLETAQGSNLRTSDFARPSRLISSRP